MAATTPRPRARAKKISAEKLAGSEQPQGHARNVFLAGLGAYATAFEEAQFQVREAQLQLAENRGKAEDFFNQLVRRGEIVESLARNRIKQIELPELRLPELTLSAQDDLRARLDKARGSFETLRDAIVTKQT
jgi:hypothetical protein